LGDKDSIRRKSRSGLWGQPVVYRILTNPAYKGQWMYGKSRIQRLDTPEGIKQHYLTRRSPDAVAVPVPAIISEELWAAAQQQLAENSRKFRTPTKRVYPLRSRLHCALCGGMFVGGGRTRVTHEYRYYKCAKTFAEYGNHRCTAHTVNADRVEDRVWKVVKAAMLDSDRMLVAVRKRQEEAAQARRVIDGALAAMGALDAKAQAKLDNYIEMRAGGEITKEVFLAKKAALEHEMAARAEERQDLEKRRGDCTVLTPQQEERLAVFRRNIAVRMTDDVPPAERAKLFELLRLECWYDDRSGEVAVSGLIGEQRLSTTPAYGTQSSPVSFRLLVRLRDQAPAEAPAWQVGDGESVPGA